MTHCLWSEWSTLGGVAILGLVWLWGAMSATAVFKDYRKKDGEKMLEWLHKRPHWGNKGEAYAEVGAMVYKWKETGRVE